MFEDLPWTVSVKLDGKRVLFDSLPDEVKERARKKAGRVLDRAVEQQIALIRTRAAMHDSAQAVNE